MLAWRRTVAMGALVGFVGCRGQERNGSTAANPVAPLPIASISRAPDAGAAAPLLLKMAHLLDGVSPAPRDDQAILVVEGRIKAVGARETVEREAPAATTIIDLSGATALPGLIDAHTHVFLQGDVTAADYDEQLLKESIPYRTIRATAAARVALLNGFTTLRDLETEGAMYADVDLKRAIE